MASSLTVEMFVQNIQLKKVFIQIAKKIAWKWFATKAFYSFCDFFQMQISRDGTGTYPGPDTGPLDLAHFFGPGPAIFES